MASCVARFTDTCLYGSDDGCFRSYRYHRARNRLDHRGRPGRTGVVGGRRDGAGVDHFIYVSYTRHIDTDDPLTEAKRAVEERLRGSGMAFTILRPSYFMEMWLGPPLGWELAAGSARVLGSGEQRVRAGSRPRLADAVLACVDNPTARGLTMELGGPAAMSPLEVVRLAESITGRPIASSMFPRKRSNSRRVTPLGRTDQSSLRSCCVRHTATRSGRAPTGSSHRRASRTISAASSPLSRQPPCSGDISAHWGRRAYCLAGGGCDVCRHGHARTVPGLSAPARRLRSRAPEPMSPAVRSRLGMESRARCRGRRPLVQIPNSTTRRSPV